jgi:hypothetical protein
MFRENKQHLQHYLISNVNGLPEKHCKHLDNSWARVFYLEFFCRLKEEPFSMQARYAIGFQQSRPARKYIGGQQYSPNG